MRILRLFLAACLLSCLPLIPAWGADPALEEAGRLNRQGVELFQAGRYQEALPLLQRARDIYETALGPEHPETVLGLHNLGEAHKALGVYDQALPLFRRALEIREKNLGPDHPDVATSLNSLAGLFQARALPDQALPLYQRALQIREKSLGPEHFLTTSSLNNLAALYQSLGAYDKALPLFRRALNIREKLLGPEDPDTATSLHNLAGLYEDMGDLRQALPLQERALKIREKVLGPEHPNLGASLNNLALLHQGLGEYEQALPLFKRALQIAEKNLGPEHPDTATGLNNLAGLYEDMSAYDQALPLYRRTLQIRKKALGPEHPETGSVLNNLAGLLQAMGAYNQALPLYQQALQIREKALGAEHPGTALSLNNLAGLHRALGAYEKALPLYQQALTIREKVLGPEHPATASTLNNLAELYDYLGAADKALPLYQRALAIHEKALGPEHPRTAVSLNNLALHHKDLGAYDQALPLYERALKIRETRLGPAHTDTVASINNLAGLHRALGAFDQALPLYERALQATEKSLGPDHPHTRTCAANLGILLVDRKNYPAAGAYFRRARAAPGLVEVSLAQGQFQEALRLLQDQTPAPRDLPSKHITFLTQKGLTLAALGRLGEAAGLLAQAVEKVEDLRLRAPGERAGFFQAGIYGGYVRPYRGLVAALAEMSLKQQPLPPALRPYGADAGEAAFYFSESTKARALLEALAQAARRQARPEIPPELQAQEESLVNSLAALESQWEKALKGGEEALQEVRDRKAHLSSELQALVQTLRQKYPVYAALHYPQPLPAADLPLRENEVLLEYALGEKASYVLVVRRGGVGKVVKIPLGRQQLEAKIKTFMEPLINRRPDGFSRRQAQELYALLLAGALREVKENDRLIIVPDGILGLLPFEALALKAGKGPGDGVFVGDRYTLTYYQSAAVMALKRRLEEQTAGRPLFALGHPVFSPKDPRVQPETPGGPKPGAGNRGAANGAFRALAAREAWGKTTREGAAGVELSYLPLPETEGEVLAIARLLGVAPRAPDVLLNTQATETMFWQSPLQEYRYLHFATHADVAGMVQGIREPFLLLGQVGNEGQNNGFLTLSKVLGLNLRADMVVLSACLTGRGRVMEGEGVANFARAFQHAGARSVVVSLWEVASMEAVEFMTLFYALLKEGKSRVEALKLAREAIKAKYPSPFYWAVFILHGEG